jgi:hypothetical protein
MRALALCFLLACGGSAPPPATTPPPATDPAPTAAGSATATPPPAGSGAEVDVEALLTKMTGFKDKLCACPDATCLEGVSDEMNAWAKDMKDKGMKEPHLNDDQTKRATAVGEEMGKCFKRISNMGG